MSKLIVIEGTDSSGKETQAKELVNRLNNNNIKAIYFSFPMYHTPTGRIVGGPYLGKKDICLGWFSEGAANVDPLVASLYFAADRRYHMNEIKQHLNEGYVVILDRYTDSNTAHQGGKITDKIERNNLYKKLEMLEYDILGLQKADHTIFLHLPYQYSTKALEVRTEVSDEHESSMTHLKNAEEAYLEIADMHNYITVECLKNGERKTKEELFDEIYDIVEKLINKGRKK